MDFNYFFDVASLAIAVIIIVEYKIRNTVASRQTRAFLQILAFATVASAFDLGSVLGLRAGLPLWFNHFLLLIYNFSFHGMTPQYLYYIMVSTKRDEEKLTPYEQLLVAVPYVGVCAIIISNFATHFLYTVDKAGNYKSGYGVYVCYVVAFYYLVTAAVYILRRRSNLHRQQKVIVSLYTFLIILAVLMQLHWPNLLIINFGVMLSILVMAFTLESPSYYEDQLVGIYNRIGFQTICSGNIANGRQFTVIGIHIDGISDIRELAGIDSISSILKSVAKFLLSITDRSSVFSISESQFAVIVEGGESEIEMQIKKIRRRFEEPFDMNGETIRLSYAMTRFSFPRDAQSTETIMDLLEYSLIKSVEQGKDVVMVANASILEEKQRAAQVLQILKKALAEGRFSVYYQPIYSVEADAFTSAEALLRLYDDDLGFISPDEFISIAEKNGLILKIGEYVFREVCRFMAENQIWEKGISYIDINLSPMQCIQDTLHTTLLGIMDEYKLDYGRISLEITETASILSGRTLRDNMQQLINKGMRFSLDDYGTGYANLSTVVDYPFSIVKLDKSMIWSAMKNDKAMTVLRQTIRMMKQLQLELIAEGVENEEQAELLAYYGCDFFQGYYYAKPQNGESFLKLLENNNGKEE